MFVFIETRLFTKLVREHVSDDEYAALQQYLAAHPEAGDVIPGSGGVRKLRWRGASRGKRGGLRVIYFVRPALAEIWMLTLYAKSVVENISATVLQEDQGGDR